MIADIWGMVCSRSSKYNRLFRNNIKTIKLCNVGMAYAANTDTNDNHISNIFDR